MGLSLLLVDLRLACLRHARRPEEAAAAAVSTLRGVMREAAVSVDVDVVSDLLLIKALTPFRFVLVGVVDDRAATEGGTRANPEVP
jgi:hypothetical protein